MGRAGKRPGRGMASRDRRPRSPGAVPVAGALARADEALARSPRRRAGARGPSPPRRRQPALLHGALDPGSRAGARDPPPRPAQPLPAAARDRAALDLSGRIPSRSSPRLAAARDRQLHGVLVGSGRPGLDRHGAAPGLTVPAREPPGPRPVRLAAIARRRGPLAAA